MSIKNIRKWTDALRSGKFKQAAGALKDRDGHCCLGVACEVMDATPIARIPHLVEQYQGFIFDGINYWENVPTVWLQVTFSEKVAANRSKLIEMNDGHEFTFSAIADFIDNL